MHNLMTGGQAVGLGLHLCEPLAELSRHHLVFGIITCNGGLYFRRHAGTLFLGVQPLLLIVHFGLLALLGGRKPGHGGQQLLVVPLQLL